MAVKCPNCGAENPEGKKFCGDCGAVIPQQAPLQVQSSQQGPIQYRQAWASSHVRTIVALVIVFVVVILAFTLIYTQPLSKVKVLVYNSSARPIWINVTVNNHTRALVSVLHGWNIVGMWPVAAGSVIVALDYASYRDDLDGVWDYAYEYLVSPLYTKNVFIEI